MANKEQQYWGWFTQGIIDYIYGIREDLDTKPPAYREGFVFAVWKSNKEIQNIQPRKEN